MDRLSVLVRPRGTSEAVFPDPIKGSVELKYSGCGGALYFFDSVIPVNESQAEFYDKNLRSVVKNCILEGVSATVFAYGSTGTGKTYTIGTNLQTESDEEVGIIPRVVKDVLEESKSSDCESSFKISFFEIYNEQIYDLLNKSHLRIPLSIKEDSDSHQFLIPSLSYRSLNSYEDAMSLLIEGVETRSIASTAQNIASSRSHAIFTLTVSNGEKNFKINMVDLAGSECLKRTMATGQVLVEGQNINKSLLALGNVIESLCSKKSHIPFRDSTLTKILRESLQSTSCYSVMIACISHTRSNITDTANTLRYADRAKRIHKKGPSYKRKWGPIITPAKRFTGDVTTPFSYSRTRYDPKFNSTSYENRFRILSSSMQKPLHHVFDDNEDDSMTNLSDISLASSAQSLSPYFRRYKEEMQKSFVQQVKPLIDEVRQLREDLSIKKKKKSRMTSSPIRLSKSPQLDSSPDLEITIKSNTLRRSSRIALEDLTNKKSPEVDLNVPTVEELEKKLGINPNSPLFFDLKTPMNRTRKRTLELKKDIKETVSTIRRSIIDNRNVSNRRRSARIQAQHCLAFQKPSHPLEVKEHWQVISQESHRENLLKILNTGNLKILQALPAVGPKSAMVLHTYRNLHGPFNNIKDIKNVPGLSKIFFQKFATLNQLEVSS